MAAKKGLYDNMKAGFPKANKGMYVKKMKK